MSIFKFYTFKNEKRKDNPQPQLLTSSDEATPAKPTDPRELFGGLFKTNGQLKLWVPKGKDEADCEIYHCRVLRHSADVAVLVLENNGSKHTIIDMKDVKHDHHPFCHVIIDNRPDSQLIGIERNAAFGSNTGKVADILSKGLSNLLFSDGRRIELERLVKSSTSLWDVVDEIVEKFNDRVTQIRLDFDGDDDGNAASASPTLCANSFLALLSSMANSSESNALFALCAKNDDGVKLDNIRTDLQHIADQCLAQKVYTLSVRFKTFGIYRYGAELAAQFCIDENLIAEFVIGEKKIEFDDKEEGFYMIMWLNRLNNLTKDNYKNEPIQPRRTRRRRR